MLPSRWLRAAVHMSTLDKLGPQFINEHLESVCGCGLPGQLLDGWHIRLGNLSPALVGVVLECYFENYSFIY